MANVIIYSPNVIGKAMAGPAIRVWEFAKVLSRNHSLTVVAPNVSDVESDQFRVISKSDPELKLIEKNAHVIITQGIKLSQALFAKRNNIRIIIDAYDPVPLELLEQFKDSPLAEKNERYQSAMTNLLFNFKMADGIICASEKQRDLWLGVLLAEGLIDPAKYEEDNSLRKLIDVVPFGLSEQLPCKTGPGLREMFHLKASDKVLLWGGGIWNWFDPLTLIKAVKRVSLIRDDVKLVFMGIQNPDPSVPQMTMAAKAIELATELGVLNRTVFFNHGWISYEKRENYYLDGTIGVSMHFDHLETRFSFRTRMLDYIWAQLPILATQGDAFAELIEQKELGVVVVPKEDEKEVAKAILGLVDDTKRIEEIKLRLLELHSQFKWSSVVVPLEKMIDRFCAADQKLMTVDVVKDCSRFFLQKVREKGLGACLKRALRL